MITELVTPQDITISAHKDKEQVLWDEFRQRLGISEFSGFTIQPSALINSSSQLQHLEEPFTVEEIKRIVKALPNNQSPGLDGFNNEFAKAAWPVIKQDFLDLRQDFYNNNVGLRSINSSYITDPQSG